MNVNSKLKHTIKGVVLFPFSQSPIRQKIVLTLNHVIMSVNTFLIKVIMPQEIMNVLRCQTQTIKRFLLTPSTIELC